MNEIRIFTRYMATWNITYNISDGSVPNCPTSIGLQPFHSESYSANLPFNVSRVGGGDHAQLNEGLEFWSTTPSTASDTGHTLGGKHGTLALGAALVASVACTA
jgi:hypothetical protein